MSTDNDSMSISRAERRQRKKKPTFTFGHLVIIVAILGIISGVGAYAYHSYYTTTIDYRVAQAFDRIDKADVKLDALHAVIDSDITEETADQVKVVNESIEPTRDLLREAADYIKKAQETAPEAEMERLVMMQESVALRGQLLGLAPDLLAVTEQSAIALRGVNVGWENLISATEASVRAKEAYDLQDKAGMLESVKLNNEALSQLARARVEFNDAERALEGLSFADYLDYIDIREQIAQAAIKAANDWTSDDKTALKVDLQHYEDLLGQALAMEDELVPPAEIVDATYQQLVGEVSAEYFQIRETLLTLDKKVR